MIQIMLEFALEYDNIVLSQDTSFNIKQLPKYSSNTASHHIIGYLDVRIFAYFFTFINNEILNIKDSFPLIQSQQ